MQLRDYLVLRDGKVSRKGAECLRIAKAAGTTPTMVYMVALGHKQFGEKLAKAFECPTNGAVTRYDLREDIFGPDPRRATKREAA